MTKTRPVPPGGGGHRPPDHKTGGNNTYPLRTTTDKELQEIITEINNHPRKHLGQATPAETYQRHTPPPQCRTSDLNTVTGILVARSARVDVPAGTSAAPFPTLPTDDALGPDFDIRQVDGTDRSALLIALAEASAILVRSTTRIDAEAIAAAPRLKVIARAGVGLDNVDVKAATAAGVMVVNAPTSNIISAAELTVGHILSLARHIPAAHASLVQEQWKRSAYTGTELYEKTVGIIGLGRIGALVASRLQAFGTGIIAYDPYITAARAQQLGVHPVSLDELLERSDVMTIHMPKTPETTGMISTAQFALMKPTAFIVNVARGGLIDEDALYTALANKTISGAGLDVFVSEPPTGSPLLGLPNVVV